MTRKTTSHFLFSSSILIALAASAACSERPAPPPTASMPSSPAPKTSDSPTTTTSIDPRLVALKALYAARSSDPSAVARAYTENATLRFGEGTELHGRTAIEANAKGEIAKLGAPTYGISRSWIKGDTVIVEETTSANPDAKGHEVGVRGLGVYWFDATGLVKEHHQYRNDLDIDAQIAGDPDAPKRAASAAMIETHAADEGGDEATSAAWVGRFDVAWTQGADAVAPYLADDVTFICTLGVDDHGKRAYLGTVKSFGAHFIDQKVTIEHVWAIGEYLATEETMRATIAASGKAVVLRFGEIFQVRNDKLVNDWAFGDARSFAKAATP